MADQKSLSFDALMRDIAAKKFAPVYFLSGDEPYYIDRLTEAIIAGALDDSERDFNQTIVYASDTTPVEIANMARRYPVMAKRQLVIVREAQTLNETEQLEAYLTKPQPATILVLACKGKADKRKRLSSLAAKAGVAYESHKLRDYELPKFISRYMKDKNAAIDEPSIQLIAESIGSDLSRLISELDKLLIAVGNGGGRITTDIVAKQIGINKDFNAIEFQNAIIERNAYKAYQIAAYFAANPKAGSVFSLTPLLFAYFQKLAIAHQCPQQDNPDALAHFCGLKSSWQAQEIMKGLRTFPKLKVWRIIYKLRETDAKSKGLDNSNTPASELLRDLIHFILS